MISERKRYEDLMKKEDEKKKKGLNDKEKKILYFRSIDTMEDRLYDKSILNDEEMQFKYLHEKSNYKPLAQRYRPFFLKPFYAKQSDFSYQTPLKTYLFRFLGSLVMMKLGYELGVWDLKYTNEKISKSKVVDMDTEEQIYDYLFNKDKTAVFLYLYSPGHMFNEKFHKEFEIESNKYSDEVVFMRVHCRKHLTFCMNKMWQNRIFPLAEVYFINEKDQIEVADMNNKHRSAPGIEAFFEEQGIIESRLDPEKILSRVGQKYLQIA
eukprot:403354744